MGMPSAVSPTIHQLFWAGLAVRGGAGALGGKGALQQLMPVTRGTPVLTSWNLPFDGRVPLWHRPPMMNVARNQFSLTREASITGAAAKKQFRVCSRICG
jgi:hypothetical protein